MIDEPTPASVSFEDVLRRSFDKDRTEVHGYLVDALEALAAGDASEVRNNLRIVVMGTIGYAGLASRTGLSKRSVHRMLSAEGNPSLSNLAMILSALMSHLEISLKIETGPVLSAAE